jgi:hypothetical protein
MSSSQTTHTEMSPETTVALRSYAAQILAVVAVACVGSLGFTAAHDRITRPTQDKNTLSVTCSEPGGFIRTSGNGSQKTTVFKSFCNVQTVDTKCEAATSNAEPIVSIADGGYTFTRPEGCQTAYTTRSAYGYYDFDRYFSLSKS